MQPTRRRNGALVALAVCVLAAAQSSVHVHAQNTTSLDSALGAFAECFTAIALMANATASKTECAINSPEFMSTAATKTKKELNANVEAYCKADCAGNQKKAMEDMMKVCGTYNADTVASTKKNLEAFETTSKFMCEVDSATGHYCYTDLISVSSKCPGETLTKECEDDAKGMPEFCKKALTKYMDDTEQSDALTKNLKTVLGTSAATSVPANFVCLMVALGAMLGAF